MILESMQQALNVDDDARCCWRGSSGAPLWFIWLISKLLALGQCILNSIGFFDELHAMGLAHVVTTSNVHIYAVKTLVVGLKAPRLRMLSPFGDKRS